MIELNEMEGAGEQGMNMGLLFFVISAITLPLAHYEQLVTLDNKSEVTVSEAQSDASQETALLEVPLENGKPMFYWRARPGQTKRATASRKELFSWVRENRPTMIEIRMDRDVPSGIYQDLVRLTHPLNIGIAQSNSG